MPRNPSRTDVVTGAPGTPPDGEPPMTARRARVEERLAGALIPLGAVERRGAAAGAPVVLWELSGALAPGSGRLLTAWTVTVTPHADDRVYVHRYAGLEGNHVASSDVPEDAVGVAVLAAGLPACHVPEPAWAALASHPQEWVRRLVAGSAGAPGPERVAAALSL